MSTEEAITPGQEQMRAWMDSLPDQIRDAGAAAEARDWPGAGPVPSAVYLGGMGGSAMAGHLAASLLRDRLSCPCAVHSDPEVPAWVGPGTLAVISSYSGETWEALEMLRTCAGRGARTLVITSGGALRREAGPLGVACFDLPAGFSPRAALGWLFVPTLLAALEGLPGGRLAWGAELSRAADLMRQEITRWNTGAALPGRDPVELARGILGRLAFVTAPTEQGLPVAVRWKNQILENAKQAAVALGFPEGAHNEIMGWRFLVDSTPSAFLFLEGMGDGERTRRGIEAARAEVVRAGGKSVLVAGHGETPAERMLSDVLLGDRVSWELARLRCVDPVPVEAITRFKQA